MRLGRELTVSPSSPTASTTSVTVTLRLYVGTRYSVSDSNNSYSVTGGFSASGSKSFSHGSSSSWSSANVTLIGTWSKTVPLSYSSRETVSFSATLSGVEATPGTARISGSVTVPLRPVSSAAAPTNVNVVRSSDARHTVSWTRQATTAAPYDRIEVQRWDSVAAAFKTIATISGTATSFVDTSTVANRRYRYAIRGTNAWGKGAYGYSVFFNTSPSAPQSPIATKTGQDIQVRWSRTAYTAAHYEVQDYADGTAQTPTVLTGENAWGHLFVNPDASRTHAYRVRARYVDPVLGTLYSAWSPLSATVQLQAPPAAPTNLQPGSGAVDATEPATLTWNHNPVDTTAQTAYELQYRPQGGTWTGTGKTTTSRTSHPLPADTFTNGQSIEWQVRTWGEHADPSPWSALAVFGTSARPTATVLAPVGTLEGSEITVLWAFYDSEDSAQTQARVALYDAAGDRLEYQTILGPRTSLRLATRAQDGQTYTVTVQVRDSAGVWSLEARETITVSYAAPPVGELTTMWDEETGTITVQISHPEPAEGEVEAVTCSLWRSANGDPWVLLADELPLDTAVVDLIPATHGVNHYRLITTSALPSTSESPAVAVAVESSWIYLNAGPNFSQMARAAYNAQVSYDESRERSLVHLAGREYPVEVTGESRTGTIQVSARLGWDSSPWSMWEAVADLPAPFCYRDPSKRVFVGNPRFSHSHQRVTREMSLSVERIDHRE